MEKNTYAEVRYYSTATICKMLDVSRAWLWDQVNAGHFPKPIKFGRLARYKAEDVERFLAAQEQVTEINGGINGRLNNLLSFLRTTCRYSYH